MSILQSENKRWQFACVPRLRCERFRSFFFSLSPRLLFRGLVIMRFFSDFFGFRTRQRKERHSRKKQERGYDSSMWKGANNETHDLRCVPEEHTDFKCFSPILLPPSPPIVVMAISGTLFAARIVRLAGTSIRKPMLTRGGFHMDIWNATDAVGRLYRK